MKFEKVIQGVQAYIQRELCPKLNDWQEIAVNLVVGRAVKRSDALKNVFQNNPLIGALGFVNNEGDVNTDELYNEIKLLFQKKPNVSIDIPMIGNIKLTASDVDKMYQIIKESAGQAVI